MDLLTTLAQALPSPDKIIEKAGESGWMGMAVAFMFFSMLAGLTWIVKRVWDKCEALELFVRTTLITLVKNYGMVNSDLVDVLRKRPCVATSADELEHLREEIRKHDDRTSGAPAG